MFAKTKIAKTLNVIFLTRTYNVRIGPVGFYYTFVVRLCHTFLHQIVNTGESCGLFYYTL